MHICLMLRHSAKIIPPSFRFLASCFPSFVTGIITTIRTAFAYMPEFCDDAHYKQYPVPPCGTRLRPQSALQVWADAWVRLSTRNLLFKYSDCSFPLFKLTTGPTVLLCSKSRASTSSSPLYTAIDSRQKYCPIAADPSPRDPTFSL